MVPKDYHWKSAYNWMQEEKTLSHLDYFLFRPNQFSQMTLHTSQQLVKHREKGTTKEEIIKWFGVIILAARFEFCHRAGLWSTVSQSKYRPAPTFGKNGMSRHRFDMLCRNFRWSHHPDV